MEKKRTRLSPYLIKQRKRLYYEIWLKVKGDLQMSELADIFNIKLDRLWKILKEEKDEQTKSNT